MASQTIEGLHAVNKRLQGYRLTTLCEMYRREFIKTLKSHGYDDCIEPSDVPDSEPDEVIAAVNGLDSLRQMEIGLGLEDTEEDATALALIAVFNFSRMRTAPQDRFRNGRSAGTAARIEADYGSLADRERIHGLWRGKLESMRQAAPNTSFMCCALALVDKKTGLYIDEITGKTFTKDTIRKALSKMARQRT